MWGRPLQGTVLDGTRTRKDIKMKLLIILTSVLAITIAEDVETEKEIIDDSVAEASEDTLQPAASSYSYGPAAPSPPKPWEPSYVPPSQNQWNNQNKYNYNPPSNTYNPPSNTYNPPSNTYNPPSNTYNPPSNIYNPPSNTYNPPSNTYNPPSNTYNPPSNTYNPPSNTYNPPSNTYNPPSNTYNPPSNTYNPPSSTYRPPSNTFYPPTIVNPPANNHHHKPSTWAPPVSTSTTTTPIPVIKNEQYFGDNGSYKYEYEIADGTHVGEEGYSLHPNTENESIVKKGWYSFTAADGKVYTVTYWADESGYHATGDHLPKPPPIPPAIQASIEQNEKEEAMKAEAEKNKPQPGGYPQQPPKPLQPHPAPVKPTPPRPQYPPQNPPQQYPPQKYPTQQYPQQQYPPQQYPGQYYPQQSPPTYYPQPQPQPTQPPQTYYPEENYPSSSGYGK